LTNENEAILEKEYSTSTHISFNLMQVMLAASYGMAATHLFWFYETEVLLPVLYIGIALFFYAVWDAFNDPLIGYISDKPNRFTKRYGRRFPFIILFGIPTMLTLILLFMPPSVDAKTNPLPVFFWLLVILLIHEVSYTGVSLARALYPEKFRSDPDRRINAAIGIVTFNIGLFMGFLVPMFFVREGDLSSYWIAAIILMIPCFICYLLGIHGVREDEVMITRALEAKREPFFKTLKTAVKRKNFMALAVLSISTQVFGVCIMASIYYYVKYILLLPLDSQADIMIMVVWLIAGLLSVPFWMKIIPKVGNKKLQIIGIVLVLSFIIPALFVRTLIFALVLVALLGFAQGATTFVRWPIFSDIIDEASLVDGKRQEGVYQGVFVFFDRIAFVLQPIIFTVMHILTRFDPEADTQTFIAQQGILAAMFWIPGLIMLTACLIFWKVYDLTPEKTLSIKNKLKELKL
jgi:GPH family glycoside/pentoside/hexuronide:cation symporter